jgi:hypothetical protein
LDYSAAVAFHIESCTDWAVTSFITAFSLPLKTDLDLLCYNLTDQFLGAGFAAVSFLFICHIELLYCFVSEYQSLLCSCCHQHSHYIFFIIKERYFSAK